MPSAQRLFWNQNFTVSLFNVSALGIISPDIVISSDIPATERGLSVTDLRIRLDGGRGKLKDSKFIL